jgi:hypothetical protein
MSIDFNEPSICPTCGQERFRTVETFLDGKWQWLRGCNNCQYEIIIGDVE